MSSAICLAFFALFFVLYFLYNTIFIRLTDHGHILFECFLLLSLLLPLFLYTPSHSLSVFLQLLYTSFSAPFFFHSSIYVISFHNTCTETYAMPNASTFLLICTCKWIWWRFSFYLFRVIIDKYLFSISFGSFFARHIHPLHMIWWRILFSIVFYLSLKRYNIGCFGRVRNPRVYSWGWDNLQMMQ